MLRPVNGEEPKEADDFVRECMAECAMVLASTQPGRKVLWSIKGPEVIRKGCVRAWLRVCVRVRACVMLLDGLCVRARACCYILTWTVRACVGIMLTVITMLARAILK